MANKKLEWFEKYGFNTEGKTYIYFPNDSYEVKDELNAAGMKFSKELLWHCAETPDEYKDKVIEVSFDEIGEMTKWGEGFFLPEVKKIINGKLVAARPVEISKSFWIGEEKERLYNIPVVLLSVRAMETKFGMTQFVKFETEEGAILQWWTNVNIPYENGDHFLLTATVKKHDTYNNVNYTTITRGVMKDE